MIFFLNVRNTVLFRKVLYAFWKLITSYSRVLKGQKEKFESSFEEQFNFHLAQFDIPFIYSQYTVTWKDQATENVRFIMERATQL